MPRLATALIDQGHPAEVFTVAEREGNIPIPDIYSFQQDYASIPLLGSLRISRSLTTALQLSAKRVDIFHNHGLWLMPNVMVGRVATETAKLLVVSPRGMLAKEALKFSRFKKSVFWALLQQHAVGNADAWHATSLEEAEDIRAFGIKAPIAVIPNGVDDATLLASHAERGSKRTVLFLSRIHPKKGLASLIAAWSEIANQRPLWELVIAGPDEGNHRAELIRQVTELGVSSIRFLEPVYGSEKASLLASADLFILPTKSENFGIAVAEALSAGLPAIVTKGAPWSGLIEHSCGWWIDHGVGSLKAALLEATSLPPQSRKKMGLRGRAWMKQSFGWKAVGRHMACFYDWIAEHKERPSFIYDK